MALPGNRKAVLAILEEISPRIMGQPHAGFTCNCGAVHSDPGIATEVEPGGDEFPGQEVRSVLWSVRISCHPEDPTNKEGFWCGLSEFIPVAELDAIFLKHFGPRPNENNPYKLNFSGSDRVHLGFPAAVRILENKHQIRFCFDWGRDQFIAQELHKIDVNSTSRRMPAGSFDFDDILSVLKSFHPDIYQGGPVPELPFESKWYLDYHKALEVAKETDHVFLQNSGESIDYRGRVLTNQDVVFMKYHLD